MIDTQAKARPYFRLMVLVAIMGFISALITFLFIYLSDQLTALIWDQAGQVLGLDQWVFTLLVCSMGGLLVGLLVRLFGDHNAIFFELMQEFGKTGRFNYRNSPGILLTALVSLAAGGSLGPEAPLADACGGTGTLISDRLKLDERETRVMGFGGLSGMLAAFITNPFAGSLLALESSQGGESGKKAYFWGLFPSLMASAVATVTFVGLTGAFFADLYVFPDYTPKLSDLLWAVPLCLVGAIAGTLFMLMFQRLRKLMLRLKEHVILRGLIGGIGMGIIGALLPLTLFSGEDQSVELIQQAVEIGIVMLVVLAFAKLLATTLLLATGWKGGYVFPIMFAGVALGMAINLLFPHLPVAVTVGATLAGALVAALRAPLFAALFTLVFVEYELAAVVAVAVMVSSLGVAFLALRQAQRAEGQEVPDETTAHE